MRREIFEKTVDVKQYIEGYVNVEKFLECCKACPNYDKIWSCPSYDFDPMDIWTKYEKLYLYGVKFSLDDLETEAQAKERMLKIKEEMTAYLFQKEKEYEGSISLSAGSCTICGPGNCTKIEKMPCKHPDTMRYSIESLGGDVGRTLSKLMNMDLLWVEEGKLPEYYVLVGGLLYN